MLNYTRKDIKETITPLSLFEKSVQTFIDTAKTAFEEAKDDLETARYLEKYRWIGRYINSKQIFHLSAIYDHLLEVKEDRIDSNIPYDKFPTKKTVGRYFFELAKLKLLCYKTIPSNYRYDYDVYWVPTINADFKKYVIGLYFKKYKEPKSKGKKTLSREDKINNGVQIRLDNYTTKTITEKILEPLKQQQKKEKIKQSGKNQREYLEEQQKAIPTPATDKIFKDALEQEKKRKAQKIVKNILAQEQREQTPEERIAQTEVILDELEKIGINITKKQLLAIEKKEEKLLLAAKNKENNFRISDDSFIDPDSNFVEFSEEIVETAEGKT